MLTSAYLGIVLLKPQMRIYIEVVDEKKKQAAQEGGEDDESRTGICGFIHAYDKVWRSLSRTEKAEAVVMVFLMFFTLFDLVVLSGGLRKQRGFDLHEDQGYDID